MSVHFENRKGRPQHRAQQSHPDDSNRNISLQGQSPSCRGYFRKGRESYEENESELGGRVAEKSGTGKQRGLEYDVKGREREKRSNFCQ